jgi:amino acid permease
VEESMEHPEHAETVLDLSVVCTVVIYGAFSILGFAAWGDGTASNILTNLPEATVLDQDIKIVTGVLLSVAMLLTVPLFFFAVFRVMEGPMARRQRGPAAITRESIQRAPASLGGGSAGDDGGLVGDLGAGQDAPVMLASRGDMGGFGGGLLSPPTPYAKLKCVEHHAGNAPAMESIGESAAGLGEDGIDANAASNWWKVSGVRVLVVLATLVLSLLLGPLFSEVISLVGAFSMSLVSFILPSAFYLRTMDGEGCKNRLVAWVILVLGVLALVVATAESLSNMVFFFSHGGVERQCGAAPTPGPGHGNHTVNVTTTTAGFWD